MNDPVAAEVGAFVASNYYAASGAGTVDPGRSLVNSGLVDSTGIIELITFLEERYGLEISDREITPENLDTIERIAAFVARKRAGSGRLLQLG